MISVQDQRKRCALDILRFPILSGKEMNRRILPDTDHHHVLADDQPAGEVCLRLLRVGIRSIPGHDIIEYKRINTAIGCDRTYCIDRRMGGQQVRLIGIPRQEVVY